MDGGPFIPPQLESLVEREIDAEETVLWRGMPRVRFLRPATLSLLAFGLFWTGFSVFWVCGAAGFQIPDFQKGQDFFPLFGVPFVLIGVGMLLTPAWHYRTASRTVYLVTDRRAVTIECGWSTTVRSFFPRELRHLHRVEHRDGTGDLLFSEAFGASTHGEHTMPHLGFFGITQAREVEYLVRQLVHEATGRKRTATEELA